MFKTVVVGVKDLQAGRDALRLAQALAARDRKLTLAHVHVNATKPAPDSGAVGSAARRREALALLAALRDESQLDAEVAWARPGNEAGFAGDGARPECRPARGRREPRG